MHNASTMLKLHLFSTNVFSGSSLLHGAHILYCFFGGYMFVSLASVRFSVYSTVRINL